jgi:WD40 repeat protein
MKQTIILTLTLLITNLVNAQSCVIAKTFVGHKEAILGIAQSPNGKYFLSGSDDNLAFLWNEDGKIIDTIGVHLKV